MADIDAQSEAVHVDVDPSVADLINDPTVAPEPEQVEPDTVIFVAFKDFEGRVNQEIYHFIQGVPVKIAKEIVNDYVESKKGYIK